MADLNALTYCRLVGLYNSVVADTVGPYGDSDDRPDMFRPYMDATITVFVAGEEGRTPELRLEDANPPRTVLLTPIDCVVEAGVFRLKSADTGVDGVDIIAKSAALGLGDTPLLCRVDFGPVRIAGRTYQYEPVTFVLPTVEREDYTAGVHQVVRIVGNPTGGLWRLLYDNSATSTLPRTATAAAVQAALRALPAIGDNVTVTGAAGGDYDVVFTGALAADMPSPLKGSDSFTGGTSPEVVVTDTYQPVTLDLSTVDRVDLAPSTPSQLVVRRIPDQVVLEDAGPPSLVRFYASGEPIGEPIPVTVDLSADNITNAGVTGRAVVRADNPTGVFSALGASETGKAVLTGDPAAARAAIDFPAGLAGADTVIAAAASAAASAVSGEIAARSLVASDDPRLPSVGETDRLVVRDRAGRVAMQVNSQGHTVIGEARVANDRYYKGFRVIDGSDRLAFEVRENGTVYVGRFADDSDGGGSLRVSTVHVLIGAGQSNMAGAAFPTDAEMDPPDPRIFQFGATDRTITTATVPLDMVGTDVGLGISLITFIARSWLQRIGPNDVVLIIPAAKGGTQLNSATATNSNGVWNVNYTGASTNMYGLLKSQLTQALAAIPTRWPGATTKIAGMFWHQGEANLGTPFDDYNGWFDAIVADLRTHLSDADMPVVLGGLVPEYSPVHLTPRSSHIDTPNRLVRTGFAEGVSNGSGYNDITHYTRQGSQELARRMVAAYDRALANTTDSKPNPPLTVTATLVSGVLTVKWDQPLCRYTGFTVEYSTTAGSTWTAITHTDVSTTATKSGVTAPVMVRVATINNVGTSATTTPVYATLGG